MKKLKILACPANEGGCAYYRVIGPAKKLMELYPEKVEIRFNKNPLGIVESGENIGKWQPDWDFEDMKWADIVWINNISNFGGPYTLRVVGKAKEMGKFVHYDTDDLLTDLYEEHRLYKVYKDKNLTDITRECYRVADLVTVTQHKFAERIKDYCGGVLAIVKNSIDYNLKCWNVPKAATPKGSPLRIGWAGGIHHEADIKQFASVPGFVNSRVGNEKVHWGFFGAPPAPREGEKESWQHDVWHSYKRILLSGFKGTKNWNIFTALPPDAYGGLYSIMDLSIAPLKMNNFNDSKSEIKVAECGRYKVPLIASNVGCYSETIENGKTGYLIDPDAPKSEWVKVLSKCIRSPKHVYEMGENLHAVTEQYFNINTVAGYRLELYEQAISMVMSRNPENITYNKDWTYE